MITASPLSWPIGWPRTQRPVSSRFGSWNNKPTIARSRDKVLNEIRLLGGSNIIISSNLKLRKDGLPYSSQRTPFDRGIAVYFNWNQQQMVIACDNFERIGCNLWAIAKTIEAMRGIERWGCSEILNRAFTGFKALPEKSQMSDFDILGVEESASKEEIRRAFRKKAMEVHPDKGGDADEFQKLNQAYHNLIEQ